MITGIAGLFAARVRVAAIDIRSVRTFLAIRALWMPAAARAMSIMAVALAAPFFLCGPRMTAI